MEIQYAIYNAEDSHQTHMNTDFILEPTLFEPNFKLKGRKHSF